MADSNEPGSKAPSPIRRRRLSRLLSILAVTSSCFLFAGAGCCFLTTLLLRPKVVSTAVGADEVAARIIDWKLPPDFSGVSGTTMDNPVLLFEIARFAHQQGRGHLIVAQMKSKLMRLPELRKQLDDLVDQYAAELKRINVEESHTLKITVNGDSSEFQIDKGDDRASTTRYRQVLGHFRGKQADAEAILILQFEDELLTDQQIEEFVNSIH